MARPHSWRSCCRCRSLPSRRGATRSSETKPSRWGRWMRRARLLVKTPPAPLSGSSGSSGAGSSGGDATTGDSGARDGSSGSSGSSESSSDGSASSSSSSGSGSGSGSGGLDSGLESGSRRRMQFVLAARCSGAQPQRCDDVTGVWLDIGNACSGSTPLCLNGACVACTPLLQLAVAAPNRRGATTSREYG